MSETIQWDGMYLASKVITLQDRIDELERKIVMQARTIRVLSEALADSARLVEVPPLSVFMQDEA